MTTNIQVRFDSVNPGAPQHQLGPGELATATNVDFSYELGAIAPRRGSTILGRVNSLAGPIAQIFKAYTIPFDVTNSPLYAITAAGTAWRLSTSGWSSIGTGLADAGINTYQQYTLIGAGNHSIKDDGVTVTDWVKQVPPTPTIAVHTLTPLDLTAGTNTFTVVNGSLVAGTSTTTFTTDANNRAQVLMLFSGPANLDLNGTNTIGAFGVHFIDLAFSDPTLVTRVSQDYSVGDANFYNYFHAELTPQNGIVDSAQPDPINLIYNQLGIGTLTSSSPTADQRSNMIAAIKIQNQPTLSGISHLSATLAPWGVTRPDFSLVGPYSPATGVDPWAQIYAVQYTIEATGTLTCTIRTPQIYGAINYPLTDINVGYTYWQTWATLDTNGNKIGESAPSAPTQQFKMQEANVTCTLAGTATGAHGITHTITYRQGGYTTSPYAINTQTYASGVSFTDMMNDIQAISLNFPLQLNVYGKSNFPAPFEIADTFQSSVFYGTGNVLQWSVPGQIDTFPLDFFTNVGPVGDDIQSLVVWPPGLIIINNYSVYELVGSDFTQGQFSLSKSGARKGSMAPFTAIKTPYGIPLLDTEGLSMYQPGQGIDEELPWLQPYQDMFRGGFGGNSPANRKGNRIPAINYAQIIQASAAFGQNKLYLAVPTGNDTKPFTMFVFDFVLHKCWWYVYPFPLYCLLWDKDAAQLLSGSDGGYIAHLEIGLGDVDNTLSNNIPVQWSATTRQWSVNADCVLENFSVEIDGGTDTFTAIYDGTATNISTLTSTGTNSRSWQTPTLNGSFANNVSFTMTGSANPLGTTTLPEYTNNVYQITFDLMDEPVRVKSFKTSYDEKQAATDKLWDVAYYDLEARTPDGISSITAITFIDNVAIMTTTFVTPFGRKLFNASFPPETYGRIAYTTYTSTSPTNSFKHWTTYYDTRVEPPTVTYWRTDIQSLDENICDGYDSDINPGGTTTATAFVDNVAVATATFTGTKRQSYTSTFPNELYGRTIYIIYTSVNSAFKQYKTWFHLRPEPDRWTNYVSDRHTLDESIWDGGGAEINALGGTVTGTAFVETTALTTFTMTGSLRENYLFTLPEETYGRVGWVVYNAMGGGKFKHYETHFNTRPEPNRFLTYVTNKFSGQEHEWKVFKPEVNPLGNTVLGTAFVDGTAVLTATMTGNTRQQYTFSIPPQTFGRSVWAAYAGTNGSVPTPFKYYEARNANGISTELDFEGDPEPPRVTSYRTGPYPFPSSNYLKTWFPHLDVINATVTGTLTVDDVVLATASFIGNKQQWYTVGLDINPITNVIQTGSRWEALYNLSPTLISLGAKFKHYETKLESEPKPFGKNVWAYSYRKLGGASQLDLARFWSIEADSPGVSTATFFWDVNGTNFTTGTITFTGGVQWEDRLSLPPGMRGYIFLFRLNASAPIKVSKVNLDLDQEGIKNLVRREVPGTPQGPS